MCVEFWISETSWDFYCVAQHSFIEIQQNRVNNSHKGHGKGVQILFCQCALKLYFCPEMQWTLLFYFILFCFVDIDCCVEWSERVSEKKKNDLCDLFRIAFLMHACALCRYTFSLSLSLFFCFFFHHLQLHCVSHSQRDENPLFLFNRG